MIAGGGTGLLVLVPDGGREPSRNLGQRRHRILRALGRELRRHPAVEAVRGEPNGKYRELRAEVDPAWFNRDVGSASLRVSWWPAPDDPDFAFHYSESSGFDCGFHHEPNPHVEGKTHYQERASSEDAYEYAAVSLPTTVPTRLLWVILDRLAERLQ